MPCQYTSYCKCPALAKVCVFDLVVEELSLFTQYPKNDISEALNTEASQYCTINENGDYIKKDGSNCSCPTSESNNDKCFGPIIADGKINRKFISVNRGLPGPTLIVHESQIMVVNVENRYSANISIHWHGMHQKKTNWMDGVDSVTQFGIYPGKKFRYIFNPQPTGTFWYHAHSELQRVDGLFGGLVILENTIDSATYGNFLDMPELHTMTLLDWNVEEDEEATVTYSPDGAEVGTDPFASGLINGKGKHPDANVSVLSTFSVSAKQRYRFRIIGVQSLYGFRFSIDGHKLKLIATDGAFVQPHDVDYIIIHAGERYDFILETKTSSVQTEYMIRAETLEVFVDDHNSSYLPNIEDPSHTYSLTLTHSAKGILRYETNVNERPIVQPFETFRMDADVGSSPITCSESDPCLAVNCPFEKFPDSYYINCLHIHSLVSLESSPDPPNSAPDKTLFLNFAFEGPKGDDSINARSMLLPSYPPTLVLPDDQNDIVKCTNLNSSAQCDDFTTERNCRCPHIVSVGKDETIRMIFSMVRVRPSITDEQDPRKYFAHPVHLHGHYFRVVDIQFGEYNDESSRLTKASTEPACTGSQNACTNPQWRNASTDTATGRKYLGSNGKIKTSYPAKDTILIPAGGYAVVYFKSNNPGVWFLHCHIGDHQVTGMAMAISEDPTNIGVAPLGLYKSGENFNWTLDEFNFLYDTGNSSSAMIPSMFIMFFALVSYRFVLINLPNFLR